MVEVLCNMVSVIINHRIGTEVCASWMVASIDENFGMIHFLKKNSTVSEISSALFWWCMPYGICSAPWLVRCNRHILHVVPMLFYLLYCCGLLILSLVGIAVCVCSQILQIYVCKLIVGEELFIAGMDSDLLLFVVLICPTIGGGIFHLRYIVPLWNGSWMSGLLYMHFFPVISWGCQLTCSIPRCPLRSHSLVCIENHLFIVGIGPILDKEL